MLRYGQLKNLNLLVVETGSAFAPYRYYRDGIKDDQHHFWDRDIARDDPALVQVAEELGEAAADGYAELRVANVPDDVEWTIEEYDGKEWVAEKHRTW